MAAFPRENNGFRGNLFPIRPPDASAAGGAPIAALRKCNLLPRFNIVYR
jgi:hypothetical protein